MGRSLLPRCPGRRHGQDPASYCPHIGRRRLQASTRRGRRTSRLAVNSMTTRRNPCQPFWSGLASGRERRVAAMVRIPERVVLGPDRLRAGHGPVPDPRGDGLDRHAGFVHAPGRQLLLRGVSAASGNGPRQAAGQHLVRPLRGHRRDRRAGHLRSRSGRRVDGQPDALGWVLRASPTARCWSSSGPARCSSTAASPTSAGGSTTSR